MLETRQLHPTLAQEVVGLRLWEQLGDATIAELRTLYAHYGVLVFRRQALSEAELTVFCALFGPLECTVRSDWASPTTSEVTVLSNLKDGLGRPIGGLGDGELQWHSDQSYMLQPATGAALYALELLPCGRQDLLGRFARRLRRLATRATVTPPSTSTTGMSASAPTASSGSGRSPPAAPFIDVETESATPAMCSGHSSSMPALRNPAK
jgi:alpha-ketoglutarate-dependent taurine dioxygenase